MKTIVIEDAQKRDDIQIGFLEVVIMPNGEIICRGNHVGWFPDYQNFLVTEVK